MIVLEMKIPQLSKPEATAARNENSIGDRMEKKPWEKPGSVGGPVPLRPDESVVCSNCSKIMASSQRLTVNTQSLFSTVSPPAVHWGYTTTFNMITVLETSNNKHQIIKYMKKRIIPVTTHTGCHTQLSSISFVCGLIYCYRHSISFHQVS